MKIIIPVSSSDIARALPHAKVLRKFGGLETHELIYFATPPVEQEAHEAAKVNGARVVVMENEPHGGWPTAPNQTFSAAVNWLGRDQNRSPFLWMELDMLPRTPGWASILEQEYIVKGKPFMGNIVPFGISRNGEIHYTEGDTMMMGCGVYPPGMHADERIRWAIANLGKPAGMQPRINGHIIAFDVYLRHPMKLFGMADTALIADQWNTGSYSESAEGLRCEPLPFDRPHRPRGGVVAKEAVLIHGCKDDSLTALLLGDGAKEPVRVTLPTPDLSELDDLVPPKPQKPVEPKKTAPVATGGNDLKADIAEVLAGGAKLTVSEVAAKVGVHKLKLGRMLNGLGFEKDANGFVRAKKVKKAKVSLDEL